MSHPSPHHHPLVHLDDAEWATLADHAELEGEVLLGFVTESAGWIAELRGPDPTPVQRILDIGSGPGVGTGELARRFPEAQVVAVDGSPAMLDRAAQRALADGLDGRIVTHHAELPGGLGELETADVIWASMSLHHVGDVPAALRALRDRLAPGGLLAIAEVADPMRVLPDDLDVGPPGLRDRIERAEADWFRALRAGLDGGAASGGLLVAVRAAGFDVAGARIAHVRVGPPLEGAARRFVVRLVGRLRRQLDGLLDAEDLLALDVLGDPDDPRSVQHRADVLIDATREIVVARSPGPGVR